MTRAYSNTVDIPQRIEKKIGYDGWTALSWALQNQWVQDYKWHFSEISGNDIGVPTTVGNMLYFGVQQAAIDVPFIIRGLRGDVGCRGLMLIGNRVARQNMQSFYELMVEGYLLGTDFVSPMQVMKEGGTYKPQDLVHTGVVEDVHGSNQLEGELRRYFARKHEIEPTKDISLSHQIVVDYCMEYNIFDAYDSFVKKLNF